MANKTKKTKKNQAMTQIDKAVADKLVTTKVNIHDGWADDVPLLYPEGSWKPDDHALIKVDIDATVQDDEITEETTSKDIKEIIKEDSTLNRRKVHPFRLFMIIWLGLLSISIAVGLGFFYEFLDEYQQTYEASRPFHEMDSLMDVFAASDMDSIVNLMTVTPDINEFETSENVKSYISTLLDGKKIEYTPTANHTDDFPEYYITADGYIIAVVTLKKQPTTSLKYNFPEWYISTFELYTDAQYSVRVEKPTNYTLCINGIPVGSQYQYEGYIDIDDKQKYFGSRVIIPQLEKYYVNAFYEKPYLTAISCFGTECEVVWNEERGIYEVPFAEPDNMDALKEYAIQAACDYTNWVSQDADDDIIDQYFEADSELLDMIKAGTSRLYFTRHTDTNIQNIQILEMTVYNEKAMYASISLDQHMTVWGEDTIVPVQCNFFYLYTDDGWKIISIMF